MFINMSALRRKQFYLLIQSVYLQYIFHKPKSPQDSTAGLKGNQKDHIFTRVWPYVCELHNVLLFIRTRFKVKVKALGHSYAQYHRVKQDFNVPLRVRVYTDLCAFANIKDNSHVFYLDWTMDREVLSADNRGQQRNRCNTEFSDLSGSLGDLFLLKFPSVKFLLILLCSSTLPQL